MIRHRPSGSGHPYSDDTEQRSPVQPVAGEPLRIGARTSADVDAVTLELRIDQGAVREVPLDRVARSSRGQAVDGGHLASAQARTARSAGGWEVVLDAPEAGSAIEYRLVALAADRPQATRWFRTRSAGWRPASDGELQVDGSAVEVDPASVAVLDDGERIHRIRFSLPLQPGEHVTGFGERYDALDHRGETLDSVVFEQYKSQGEHRRTYLPMPFAHVIGGEGWGFHVRTSRRVWFDVGRSRDDRLAVEAEVDAAPGERSILSLGLYAGPPTAVLEAFVAETGRPEALPDWVFGLWASGNEWNTQA